MTKLLCEIDNRDGRGVEPGEVEVLDGLLRDLFLYRLVLVEGIKSHVVLPSRHCVCVSVFAIFSGVKYAGDILRVERVSSTRVPEIYAFFCWLYPHT